LTHAKQKGMRSSLCSLKKSAGTFHPLGDLLSIENNAAHRSSWQFWMMLFTNHAPPTLAHFKDEHYEHNWITD
jgi:hypothetical protein